MVNNDIFIRFYLHDIFLQYALNIRKCPMINLNDSKKQKLHMKYKIIKII